MMGILSSGVSRFGKLCVERRRGSDRAVEGL